MIFAMWFVVCRFFTFHKTTAVPDRIPEPNTCKPNSQFGWDSSDCPPSSLCVPSSSNSSNYCSCSYTYAMLELRPDRTCGPSTGTYVFAAFWIPVAFASLLIAFYEGYALWLSYLNHAFKLDVVIVSCLFNLASAILGSIHRSILVGLLLADMNGATYNFWTAMLSSFLIVYSVTVLTTALVFGVAAHGFFLSSYKLRSIDFKRLKLRAVVVALFLGIVLFGGNATLLAYSQYALSLAYLAIFSGISWLLFRRVLKHAISVSVPIMLAQSDGGNNNSYTNANTSQALSASAATATGVSKSMPPQNNRQDDLDNHNINNPNTAKAATRNRKKSASSASQIILEMKHLAAQLAPTLLLFSIASISYSIMWYVGKMTQNRTVLGPALAAVNLVVFVVLTTGIGFVALFTRRFSDIRILRVRLTLAAKSSSFAAQQLQQYNSNHINGDSSTNNNNNNNKNSNNNSGANRSQRAVSPQPKQMKYGTTVDEQQPTVLETTTSSLIAKEVVSNTLPSSGVSTVTRTISSSNLTNDSAIEIIANQPITKAGELALVLVQ